MLIVDLWNGMRAYLIDGAWYYGPSRLTPYYTRLGPRALRHFPVWLACYQSWK